MGKWKILSICFMTLIPITSRFSFSCLCRTHIIVVRYKKSPYSPQTRIRFSGESKQVDKLLKHTVLALHRAIINCEMSR